jgi:hypothetical protein
MWDLISPSTAATLISELSVDAQADPFAESRRALWAVLALIAPNAWAPAYSGLPSNLKEAVLEGMTPDLVARLPVPSTAEVAEVVRELPWPENPSEARLGIGAYLHQLGLFELDIAKLRLASPLIRSSLLPRFRNLVDDRLLEDTITELQNLLDEEVRLSKVGQRGIGGTRTTAALARALMSSRRTSDTRVQSLISAAADARVPADLRLEAWQALHAYGWERPLPRQYRRWISHAPTRGAPSFFGDVTEPLLEILQQSVSASFGYSSRLAPVLLSASRNSDSRVRQVAIEIAANSLRSKSIAMLETILLTALYDPKEEILVSGLLGLRRAGSVTRALIPAVGKRLLEFDGRIRPICSNRRYWAQRQACTPLPSSSVISSCLSQWLVSTAHGSYAMRQTGSNGWIHPISHS